MHYKNFKTVVYCTEQSMHSITEQELEKQIAFMEKYVGVDKVYVEPYRDNDLMTREQIRLVKAVFAKHNIETAGGLTTTVAPMLPGDENRQRLFNTFCYSAPHMRARLKEVVELIASEFDEFIIDDFFFTNCTCEDCRKAKGERTWEQFRLELMREVSENLILKPARAVNPKIRVTIKYPNWNESYQETGYNPREQRDMYEMIYTGTETRHPRHSDQHLPRYLSYNLMRLNENVAPGRNGGGWFDPYQCYPMDCYLEQAYLTVLSKPREVMMFCWGSLYNSKLATPMGFQLGRLDSLMSQTGNCTGVNVYHPLESQGEDHVEEYLGMCGIPFESVPDFPMNAHTLFLTASALKDPDILTKLESYVANGGHAVVTSGFVIGLQGKGIEQITSLRYRGRSFSANEYLIGRINGWGADVVRGFDTLHFPLLENRNNATWCNCSAINGDENYGIVLHDTYGKGDMTTVVLPDEFSNIKNLPEQMLLCIRYALLGDGKCYLEGPAQHSLFTYDNDVLALYSYTADYCKPECVKLHVQGKALSLTELERGRTIKPLYTSETETVFNTFSEPGDFAFYKINFDLNAQSAEKTEEAIGSAPHDF